MLILDLDDTIFETASISLKIFSDAISSIKLPFINHFSEQEFHQIVDDLWCFPMDVVFAKHNVPKFLIDKFYISISEINFVNLEIETFSDYHFLKDISERKILVTTGIEVLQMAKINALKIEEDFCEIYIDDPRRIPRLFKSGIFKRILNETNKDPSEIWVIGDNPDAEIRSAHLLGMRTIQRLSPSKTISDHADFQIQSFEELKSIIY